MITASSVDVMEVSGRRWADLSDSGGCSLPQTKYKVNYALALGDEAALGDLKYTNNLCGQVLRVTCEGNHHIDAVIVSPCEINKQFCGIDMVQSAWDEAT